MRNCLNCRFEPTWSEPVGNEYPRQSGMCKWDMDMPAIPKSWMIVKNSIIKYKDDSGVMTNCKTWERKI